MEKIEYRAVIRFFVLKSLKAKEIYEQLLEAYKESSPSKRTVEFWAGEFKRGRTSLEDDPRKGRPKTATTAEIIEQVHNMVSDIQVWLSVKLLMPYSDERVLHILHKELRMKKLFGKLVPHTLTIQQKLDRKQIS